MPTWSPDGTKIAFTRFVGTNMEVFTMDADTGANQENLTKNPARDYNPSCTDGVTISFTTSRDGNAGST